MRNSSFEHLPFRCSIFSNFHPNRILSLHAIWTHAGSYCTIIPQLTLAFSLPRNPRDFQSFRTIQNTSFHCTMMKINFLFFLNVHRWVTVLYRYLNFNQTIVRLSSRHASWQSWYVSDFRALYYMENCREAVTPRFLRSVEFSSRSGTYPFFTIKSLGQFRHGGERLEAVAAGTPIARYGPYYKSNTQAAPTTPASSIFYTYIFIYKKVYV